jgi:hypothetical protein
MPPSQKWACIEVPFYITELVSIPNLFIVFVLQGDPFSAEPETYPQNAGRAAHAP